MARGFLAGALWGGVLSIGVAGVASVMSPLPQSPLVGALAPGETLAPDAVAPDGQTAELSDTVGASNPAQDTAPAVADAPQATAPVRDTLSSLDSDTLSSAAAPQTGQADNLAAPAAVLDNGSAAPQSEDPVFPNPQALAPMEPQAADSLSISTEPAQPSQLSKPTPVPMQTGPQQNPRQTMRQHRTPNLLPCHRPRRHPLPQPQRLPMQSAQKMMAIERMTVFWPCQPLQRGRRSAPPRCH
jgi:hypothetical protein